MEIHLDQALSIAREAHQGQTRRHGAPYIGHPAAVKTLVDDIGPACGIAVDDATRAVALLHDVLEDNEVGIDEGELAARFGDDVAHRVDLLTKTGKGRDATVAYYTRLTAGADDALRLVKVCDRLHNLSELHLAPDRAKLDKYVDETLELIVPLARAAQRPNGLVSALHEALRTACRAQGVAPPSSVALPRVHVPLGIYAILDAHNAASGALDVDELEERVGELVDGGVAMIQVRAKNRTDREVLTLLEVVLRRCRRAGVPVVVNDRPDLCVAAGADGVHVGQSDLPPLHARRIVGDAALVGASSHTEAQLADACAEGGADHVAVGPVFASTTKSGHADVVGVENLAKRTHGARFPIVAIGGVTSPARVLACVNAGARLVAAVSALDGPGARLMCRRMALTFAAAR